MDELSGTGLYQEIWGTPMATFLGEPHGGVTSFKKDTIVDRETDTTMDRKGTS